jgi:hypothetical protein
MDFYPPKTSIQEERKYRLRLEGANGADPEKELGQGVTVTRTGEGAYLLTWATNPGTFLGWSAPGFGAATPADLKGYTAVRDTYDATAHTLAFVVYDSTFTAADLIVNQWADLEIAFSTTPEAA